MTTTTVQWRVDVDRGPAWLFLRVHPPSNHFADYQEFAETIWETVSAHFTYRVVLEMENVRAMPSHLIGELVRLQKRLQMHGGVLRLCGLSDESQRVLRACRLDDNLMSFPDRESAVKAFFPAQV